MTIESENRAQIEAEKWRHESHMIETKPTHEQIAILAHTLHESAQQNEFRETDGQDMGPDWYWYEAQAAITAWINMHPGEEYTLEKFFAATGGFQGTGGRK